MAHSKRVGFCSSYANRTIPKLLTIQATANFQGPPGLNGLSDDVELIKGGVRGMMKRGGSGLTDEVVNVRLHRWKGTTT